MFPRTHFLLPQSKGPIFAFSHQSGAGGILEIITFAFEGGIHLEALASIIGKLWILKHFVTCPIPHGSHFMVGSPICPQNSKTTHKLRETGKLWFWWSWIQFQHTQNLDCKKTSLTNSTPNYEYVHILLYYWHPKTLFLNVKQELFTNSTTLKDTAISCTMTDLKGIISRLESSRCNTGTSHFCT